jgi:hypothetical protein
MHDHEDDAALLDAYSRTVIDTLERTRAGVVSLQLAPKPGARGGSLVEPEGRAEMGRSQRRQAGQIPRGICPARRLAIIPLRPVAMTVICGTGH